MKDYVACAQSIVRAKPNEVFNAFVNAETMSRFWFTRRDNGLKAGETVQWYVGQQEDAYAIEIRVKELVEPWLINIDWRGDEGFTQVAWRLSETPTGDTVLKIEETGFDGSEHKIVTDVLNSTAGFNQVIIALKALLEHNAVINVVEDHV